MYPNNQMPPPNQLPGPMSPPPQNDPYSFITNNPAPAGRSLGPSSMKGRIILVSALAVLLLIAFIIVSSILGKAGKAQTGQYIAIAKSQTEIIRLSTMAEQKAKTPEGRSLALTTRLSFTSAQQEFQTVLAKNGVPTKQLTKELSASKNVQSDNLLDEAEKNNRYDETYTEIVQKEITDYKKLLVAAGSGANAKDKKILENDFNQASVLFPDKTN